MNYYPFHINDFRGATAHLTNEEELAYRRAIDWYYDTESPIPLETQWVARRLRVDEKDLVSVLHDFFVLTENGYVHERCESEIDHYRKLAEKNRANGAKGGRPKSKTGSQENPVGFQSVANGIPLESELNPNQEPRTKNQEIHTESTTPERAVYQGCALAEVIAMYHEKLPMLPRVKIVSHKRKALLKTRQRDYPKAKDAEWWQAFFERAAESKFLTGNAGGNWLADFDFLLSPKGFTGVIEGKYQ